MTSTLPRTGDPVIAGVSWSSPLLRGAIALVTALVITFSGNHSSSVGLLSFAVFAVLTSFVLFGFGVFRTASSQPVAVQGLTLVQASTTLLAGILAIVFWQAGTAVFLYLVAVWAAVSGFAELYLGLRYRGLLLAARDWVFAGALSCALSLVFLLLPADFRHEYQITHEGVSTGYVLDAAIAGTGILGFYTAILGVYLLIAGVSLKRTPTEER